MYRMQADLQCDTVLDGDVDLAALELSYVTAVDIICQRQCILEIPSDLLLHSDAFS